MFYSNLSILGRRVFWAVLIILLSIAILVIHGAVRVKATSMGGSTATASMSTGTHFGFVSSAAQGRNAAQADNVGEGVEVITTDVFLYPSTAIYAEGHPVYISGTTTAKSGRRATTTIWVDEDEDGIRDAGEYITGPSSVFASYYIYGGSDSISVNTAHVSISMTGGEVGAIFAGGHYQNVTTKDVNIEITGGSVHYVDCGSMRGDGDIALSATGYINVLLKDCIYRCNVPINAISKESFRCSNVTVRDFSSHRNAQSYNRHYPVFNHYIAPIGLDSYVFGGNVTVPEDRDIQAAHVALADSAVVTNLGKVSVVTCKDIHLMGTGAAVWNGNEISAAHNESDPLYYSYKTHTRQCSDCKQIFTRDHVWVYRYDNFSSPCTHTVKCGICDYSYCEPCEEFYSHDNSSYIRMKTCRFCRNETVVGKNNVANNQSPVCSHRNVSSISLSKYHDELDPEGRKQYTSVHGAAKYCTDCKQILPFTLTYGGSEYHFRDLGPLSRFIIRYKIAQAEVKMNCDAFNTFWNDTLYTAATGVINFDLNGCDLIRKVIINSGRVNFTNSQFAANSTENHYAYIPYGDVEVRSGATASFDGCAIHKLNVGKRDAVTMGNVILSNVIVDNLYVADYSKLTINGKVLITEQFQKTGDSMAPYIPVGYVLMENIGKGVWIKKFTRKESWITNALFVGPLGNVKSGYLGIMPCPQHKLSTASSNGASTHTGTCLYCEASVSMNHDLSAGSTKNDSTHTVKCNVCSYTKTGTVAYHDYGMDGKCLVPGCTHKAAVSVHGQYSPLKTYFHTFDDALEAANVAGMHDTITMYQNQTISRSITLNKKLVRVFTFTPRINLGNGAAVLRGTDLDSVAEDSAPAPIAHAPAVFDLGVIALNKNTFTSMGPRIYIDGGTYQLGKSTSGSINVNGMTANEHFRLEMSGNTSKFSSTLPITPAPGYEKVTGSTGWISVRPCTHPTGEQTYEPIKDEYSTSVSGVDKYMADHKIICSNCNRVVYEKHSYVTKTVLLKKQLVCEKCGVKSTQVIAARVLWTTTDANGVSTENFQGYKTLTEAWNSAIDTSIVNNVECTIQVLADIDLQQETGSTTTFLSIPSDKSTAKLVLEAIDDEGREHKIIGASGANTVIEVQYGKLTIKSGIYQGYKVAVLVKSGSGLTLQGGTFLPGKASTSTRTFNGLFYNGTVENYTLLRTLPYGYAITFITPKTIITDKFDMLFGSNLYNIAARPNPVMAPKGRVPLYNPLTITDVSGTVAPCPHSSYTEWKEKVPTCTSSGRPKYYHCDICKYYIDAVSGSKKQEMGSIDALGHSFGTNHRCTRCDVYENGIVYGEYDADGRLVSGNYGTVTGFASVWKNVYDLDKAAPEGHFIKVRLLVDETVSAGTIVSPNTYKHPIEVDLNGYSLDFGSTVWQGHYPHLTVKDERRSGRSVLTGSFQEFEDEKVLVLDGVTYRTTKLNCPNLEMVNGAVLVMDGGIKDDASITLKNISMEEGCKMRGEGCSHFTLLNGAQYSGVYDYDLNESVADLAHSLGVTQLNGRGETVQGKGDPKIWNNSNSATGKREVTVGTNPANTGYVYYASTCYTWEATKHDVEHALKGRECSECGHTTQHLMLFDGYSRNSSYHKPEYDDRQYKEVAYRCDNISQNVWTPLYVPFSIRPGDYTEDYDLADIYSFGRMYDTNGNGRIDEGDDTWLIVDLMTSGLTDPNYPYLVRMKSTTSSPYCFVGADGYAYAQALNSIGCSTAQTKYTFTGSNGGSTVPAGTLVMTDGALKPTSAVTTPRDHTWYVSAAPAVAGSAELRQALSSGIRVMLLGEDISEETAIRLLQGETVEVDLGGKHYTLDGRKATTTESGLKIVNGKKVIIAK